MRKNINKISLLILTGVVMASLLTGCVQNPDEMPTTTQIETTAQESTEGSTKETATNVADPTNSAAPSDTAVETESNFIGDMLNVSVASSGVEYSVEQLTDDYIIIDHVHRIYFVVTGFTDSFKKQDLISIAEAVNDTYEKNINLNFILTGETITYKNNIYATAELVSASVSEAETIVAETEENSEPIESEEDPSRSDKKPSSFMPSGFPQ